MWLAGLRTFLKIDDRTFSNFFLLLLSPALQVRSILASGVQSTSREPHSASISNSQNCMCAVLLSHPYNRTVDFLVPPIHNPWWTPLHTLAGLLLHLCTFLIGQLRSLYNTSSLPSHILEYLSIVFWHPAQCFRPLGVGLYPPPNRWFRVQRMVRPKYRLVHLPVLHHIPLSHSPTPFTNPSQLKQVISGTKYGVTQV